MRYCSRCGAQINDSAMFCPGCGERLDGNSNAYGNAGYSQPQYAQQVYYNTPPAATNDGNSTGLNVLSFFFPLVGLILYLVNMDKKPIMAKGVGKWALIGFIVSIVLSVIGYVVTLGAFMLY